MSNMADVNAAKKNITHMNLYMQAVDVVAQNIVDQLQAFAQ